MPIAAPVKLDQLQSAQLDAFLDSFGIDLSPDERTDMKRNIALVVQFQKRKATDPHVIVGRRVHAVRSARRMPDTDRCWSQVHLCNKANEVLGPLGCPIPDGTTIKRIESGERPMRYVEALGIAIATGEPLDAFSPVIRTLREFAET